MISALRNKAIPDVQWRSRSILQISMFVTVGFVVVFSEAAALAAPSLKLPLPPNKQWLLTVEIGGKDLWGQTDTYHTDSANAYYALDFDNISKESGIESDVDIVAAGAGTVTVAGGTGTNSCDGAASWGYTVEIKHDGGYFTRYAHLKELPLVTVGQQINQGQRIGIMGNTGSSCGVHLHFEISYNGESKSTTTQLQGIVIDGKAIETYRVGTADPWTPLYYPSSNVLDISVAPGPPRNLRVQ